jgi:predicted PurR-regulated permease PerM
MEAMGILGFIFGLIAFVRLKKLTKTLKEKGILEQEYKEE